MTGHGGDVKGCDWHPTKAVLASGSKDGLVKVWDAKTGRNIATLHGHRNTVMQTLWNANGNWLLSACRDQSLKVRPATCCCGDELDAASCDMLVFVPLSHPNLWYHDITGYHTFFADFITSCFPLYHSFIPRRATLRCFTGLHSIAHS